MPEGLPRRTQVGPTCSPTTLSCGRSTRPSAARASPSHRPRACARWRRRSPRRCARTRSGLLPSSATRSAPPWRTRRRDSSRRARSTCRSSCSHRRTAHPTCFPRRAGSCRTCPLSSWWRVRSGGAGRGSSTVRRCLRTLSCAQPFCLRCAPTSSATRAGPSSGAPRPSCPSPSSPSPAPQTSRSRPPPSAAGCASARHRCTLSTARAGCPPLRAPSRAVRRLLARRTCSCSRGGTSSPTTAGAVPTVATAAATAARASRCWPR
mmetsp:Transcript_32755/g.75574  ORF Transcript_32755/g.75574 Transcript_32755/m.75574 type:complete len:264 (-) Transcript_32755:155-946(-)